MLASASTEIPLDSNPSILSVRLEVPMASPMTLSASAEMLLRDWPRALSSPPTMRLGTSWTPAESTSSVYASAIPLEVLAAEAEVVPARP